MTVWCHLPTIFKRRFALRLAGLLSLCVALTTTLLFATVSHAFPSTDRTLSFQARLLSASGAVVPDGYYNVQFKIYHGGTGTSAGNPGGTLDWTETYINNGGNNGVEVRNGYLAVQLGSLNAFGTSVDWNLDDLWLSMNVAGSSTSCTSFGSSPCVADGEMVPMKRITATPYSLNSGALNGLTSSDFLQLAQGLQTDANAGPSIYLNKTNTGNLVQLQSGGVDAFTVDNDGNLLFGGGSDHTIGTGVAGADTTGKGLSISAGGGGSGGGSSGGILTLQGGSGGGTNGNGGDVVIDGGVKTGSGTHGNILIGQNHTDTILIGSSYSSGTQFIGIGVNDHPGGITNVEIGSRDTAAGGYTSVQAKDYATIKINGTNTAVFSNDGRMILGNGFESSTPAAFSIQGTSSNTSGVNGSTLTVQGGDAYTGNANGGNLILNGGTGSGTGSNGLVVLSTPTFSTTTNDANCYASGALVASSCTIAMSSVNNSSAIIVGFNTAGQTATLPDPTNTTAGRVIYVTAANGSSDFTLSANGGGTGNLTSMRQNTTATMIWNGSDWTVAGASNSTTLQSAYDNTLQSAGGAELIVSSGANANGLTIRDSSSSPVSGALIEVQNSSAATLFSVSNNIPEYATNGGAETAGASASAFPSNTWGAYGSSTVSRYTTAGNFIASGQASTQINQTGSAQGVYNRLSSALIPNMTYNVSFAVRLTSGSFTDMGVWYSHDATNLNTCKLNNIVLTSAWTKVNCSFKAPASGITSSNTIVIGSASSATRTYYVDNLSVSLAADLNYATDGNVNDNTNFATNWGYTTGTGTGSIQRYTADGYEASDSALVNITSGAANAGLRNKLSVNPLTDTLYKVSVYATASVGSISDFKIRYSRDAGTNFVDCVDYNTQTITAGVWTQVTCYINTDSTAATNPQIYFVKEGAAATIFGVDAFSMNLATNTAPNVQIGGGATGGPTTLFTLDKGAAAPIAANNDALLGSMYYDTTIGKIQCYEADGWGACGSSPDNIVTISPEYTNAVMRGTGVGTMTSDLCSDTLNINDGSSGQPTICGTNETFNFYKWTSPQATSQTYSIYVTYQLPNTFKEFTSGSTSLMGRTDSADSSVTYQIYKNSGTGLTACGSEISVSTGSQSTWQTKVANGAADPSACQFAAGNSIIFKINMTSSDTANAYVGNLGFTYSNR